MIVCCCSPPLSLTLFCLCQFASFVAVFSFHFYSVNWEWWQKEEKKIKIECEYVTSRSVCTCARVSKICSLEYMLCGQSFWIWCVIVCQKSTRLLLYHNLIRFDLPLWRVCHTLWLCMCRFLVTLFTFLSLSLSRCAQHNLLNNHSAIHFDFYEWNKKLIKLLPLRIFSPHIRFAHLHTAKKKELNIHNFNWFKTQI